MMKINESIISKALRESIMDFINEDGATAAGGGATTSFNVGAQAGNDGAGNGFEYDVPMGTSKSKGGTVMRRMFWTAGNNEKTMQSVDDEGSDVINKRKK